MNLLKIYITLLLVLQGTFLLWSQKTIFGIVTNETEELLAGASVYWKDKSAGVSTDENGTFRILAKNQPDSLLVLYAGYNPVAIAVQPGEDSLWIVIEGIKELAMVEVTEHQFGNSVSTLNPRNVERIGSKELKKAPCCNLSESFETNGTVDVAFPNALTGVKEIQMLGLRGIYTQFLIENRPTMTGIATPFAFEMIPGTWLSGIALAKGASSVKNGSNGIAGQISTDLQSPLSDEPLFVNLFTSTEGRGEANIHLNKRKKNHANGVYLHGSFVENKWDRNRDQFYDMPNRSQLNGMFRHMYQDDTKCYQINFQGLTDRRTSGQISPFVGQSELFAVQQQNDRMEVWGKYGLENIDGKSYRQLGNIFSSSWHRTNAQYGANRWEATQQSMYWQSLYQDILGNTNHTYVLAPSVQIDNVAERVNEQVLDREETQAGLMGEYTYSRPNLDLGIPDLVIVAGARIDYNTRFQQWQFTPRISAKYNASVNSVFRLSAGKGYRSPHLVAENVSLLASNKTLQFAPNMGMESAWNYGVNYTQQLKWHGRPGSISLDLYRTDFINQVLVDVDQSPLVVAFYEVKSNSFSQIALITAQYEIARGLELKVSGKYQDARAIYSDGIQRQAVLLPKYRGLVTLDYTTPNKKWMFNLRTQVIGEQRLPDNSQIPHEYLHGFPEQSPTYSLWSGQVTYKLSKQTELYLGGENLTNFQQHEAIIAVREPSSPYFNGAQLWAPMGGNIVYLGLRYSPDKAE